MQDLLRQIKFYFTYHRKDKYGIIVLLVFCVILLAAPDIHYQFIGKQKIIDHINITNENFARLVKQIEAAETIGESADFNNEKTETPVTENSVGQIDINLTTATALKQLKGIGEVFSKRIIKYRDSKNGFDSLEDLKNVYGITDSLYDALLPRLTFTTAKKLAHKKSLSQNNYKNNFEKPKPSYENKKKPAKKIKPAVTVDINTATAIDLKQLKGIGKVLSERIVKFRDAIGGFEKIEQLNEVYGIEDSLYFALLDNVEMSKVDKPAKVFNENFEEETASATFSENPSYLKNTTKAVAEKPAIEKPETEKIKAKPKTTVIVDINKATAEEFQQLSGIGKFRANEIISQREQLGGFYNIEQLKEVYSFDDSLVNALKPQLSISKTSIRKININTVEFKALLKHPYFDYSLTKHLINFREQRKGLKSLEDLKESFLIDEALYEKLIVYLTVE